MPRLLLLDASPGLQAAVDAVSQGCHTVLSGSVSAPAAQAEAIILDATGGRLPEQPTLERLTDSAPVLLIVDRTAVLPTYTRRSRHTLRLRSPFHLFDLRARLEALLQGGAGVEDQPAPDDQHHGRHQSNSTATPTRSSQASAPTDRPVQPITPTLPVRPTRSVPAAANTETQVRSTASRHGVEPPDWRCSPLVSAHVEKLLLAAARMEPPLCMVAEPGCGKRRIAHACAAATHGSRAQVRVWDGTGPVPALRVDDHDTALIVTGLERLDGAQQELLRDSLSRYPQRKVFALSDFDLESMTAAGTFCADLYYLLSPLALRIDALRQRPEELSDIAHKLANYHVECLGGQSVAFTRAAGDLLRSYEWPGNIVELNAVMARSVALAGGAGLSRTDTLQLNAEDIVLAPYTATAPPDRKSPQQDASAPARNRRAVVLPLEAPSRRATGLDAKPDEPLGAVQASDATTAQGPASMELVVAGLAHDLRNPMAVLKTFATLTQEAGQDEDHRRVAGLARDACDDLDHHMDLLQQFCALQGPQATALDVVSILTGVLAERSDDACARVVVDETEAAGVMGDPSHLRFVAEALADEITAGLADGAYAKLTTTQDASGQSCIRLAMSTAGAAQHLRTLVADDDASSLSWRMMLAASVAARNGGEIQVTDDANDEGRVVSVVWRLPAAVEVGDGAQASSTDR